MRVTIFAALLTASAVAATELRPPITVLRGKTTTLRGGEAATPVSVPKKATEGSEKLAMTAAVVGIVGAWLAVATVYYAARENWPYAQSFFYAVDTGMSIGFGTVAEQRVSTKAFTILHVLLGASAVGGAIALFADSAISGAAAVAGSEYARASVRAAFVRADTDHSGSLSTVEFEAVLKKCGLDLPPAEMAAAVAVFDDDGSGSVEIDEFLGKVIHLVDSQTSVAEAVVCAIRARQMHPVARWLEAAGALIAEHRVIVLWMLWVGGGALWGAITYGWDPVSALYFAVGALATGGLEGPGLDAAGTIPDSHALFVALFCLTGIPIFAMALGQFANILIERHIAAREQRALSTPISEDEFEFAQQLATDDGKIDLYEFVVLELYRLGKLDEGTMQSIKAEFKRLDKDGDGAIRKQELGIGGAKRV